jgi:hypothetical protein
MSSGIRTLVIERKKNHIFEDYPVRATDGYSALMVNPNKKVSPLKGRDSVLLTDKLHTSVKKEADIMGIIGIINITGCNYMAAITDA